MRELAMQLIESMRQTFEDSHAEHHRAGVSDVGSPNAIQNARQRLGLSQQQFADLFGVSVTTIQKWERRRLSPSGAAKALLQIIALEPDAVLRALATAKQKYTGA